MGWFKSLKTNETNTTQLVKKDNNDIFIKNSLNTKIEEFSPKKYDEVEIIANTLILGKSIKLNLENTETTDRKRIIDFLCGIAFVLDLDVKCIENNIYQFIKNLK